MKPPYVIRNQRRVQASKQEAERRRWWRINTIRGGCVMCAAFPLRPVELASRHSELRKLEAHHLLPKRDLKRQHHADKLWDERNGMCLCELHHARHERYVHRVPRSLLPAAAFEFADEVGLGWLLDAEYPV